MKLQRQKILTRCHPVLPSRPRLGPAETGDTGSDAGSGLLSVVTGWDLEFGISLE